MTTQNELKFLIYLIHSLADSWNKLPSSVYKILNDSGILDDYIVKCYDVLHTMGKNALVEDITDFAKERGVAI